MLNISPLKPRIYIACLAAYNSGQLHGKWINADSGIEIIWEEIKEILTTSPQPNAEEFAIHDSEFLGHVREYQSIEDIVARAKFISEHGEIAIALLDHHYETQDAINAMENYLGEYDSELDFAYRLIDDCGTLDGLPEHISRYFDYESFARDLFLDGHYSIKDGTTCYVFSDH
jgi:antirestriction protein